MDILIVDDEQLALNRLERLLNGVGITTITACNNPNDAILEVSKKAFDVVFLDINMPQMSGLELAERLNNISPDSFLVFQTAYDEYALDAYNCGGLDYLVKPIEADQISKVIQRIKKYQSETPKEQNNKLMGKRGNRIYLMNIEDIYYIKADLDEVIVKIKDADVNVKKKIGDLEKLLTDNFFRVHRSAIVNIDKIKNMESIEQSKLLISFKEIDDVITSSKDGAKEFRELLEQRSL